MYSIRTTTRDFNPRTREGCDYSSVVSWIGNMIISIHAPVKGATWIPEDLLEKRVRISIHAPVKGATRVREDRVPYDI